MTHLRWLLRFGFAALVIQIGACGGGADSGRMTLAVSDAPVDGAEAVVLKFTGVQLVPAAGNPIEIDFSTPKTIDLLTQSGTASALLFDQPIPSGSYEQIRLLVLADGDPSNSYITLQDGTQHGLNVPSGAQTGLKLVAGFDVPGSGVVDYTVDFDLRKAITCPGGQSPACFLKPALRLVNNAEVGNIQGVVAASLVPTSCSPGVYLYNGTVTAPEDMNSAASADDANQPIASKMPVVTTQSGGGYYYQFTFLPPGTYTVALTCQASADNPVQPDSSVTFSPVKGPIDVTAGQTTEADLP